MSNQLILIQFFKMNFFLESISKDEKIFYLEQKNRQILKHYKYFKSATIVLSWTSFEDDKWNVMTLIQACTHLA